MSILYEKRTSARFIVRCLVNTDEEYSWSKDISSTGVYFVVQQSMRKNEVINLTIELNKECVVQCEGEVIRTDKQIQGYGVAVQFSRMMFDRV